MAIFNDFLSQAVIEKIYLHSTTYLQKIIEKLILLS